jgi:hypothetical protein
MEDERITKTILSALLKKDVVEVEMRKHEYSNGSRDKISMFRLDFAAKVRQEDGSLKLILIELQKTWLETETLRFRQYLGTQYSDPANIIKGDNMNRYAIPMVTVYMLGHRVGDIEEPVLYVNHKSYNYDGVEVTKGIPDPFVDSLVHDSIIVQIPLLRGTINNRLDKVLSVFDQSHKDKYNQQVLNFDDNAFEDDVEMRHILHRLLAAASDAKLRQDMNVEDEYFSAIEDRDTAIMLRDKKIAERDAKLAKQGTQLAEQEAQLAEQEAQLAEQGAQLVEQGTQLAERDAKLAEQGTQLAEKEAQLAEKDKALLSSAKALKQAGLSVKQIAAMTKLSEDTISLL